MSTTVPSSHRLDRVEEFLAAHPGRRFATPSGPALVYRESGDPSTPPAILVHGNPTWSYLFRRLIDPLAERFRVITMDHVGCGESDRPSEQTYGYRLADRVADLEALMDHLDPNRPFTLIAHDWGALIGLAAAVRRPHRFGRLAVMNTAAFPLPANRPFPRELVVARLPLLGQFLVCRLNLFCKTAARRCVVHPLSTEVRRGFLYPYDSPERRRAVHRFVRDVPLRPGDPSWDLLVQTSEGLQLFQDRPFWIGWGQRDFLFDAPFLEEWRRRVPFAEYALFPNAGHYLLEDDFEAVASALIEFVNRTECIFPPHQRLNPIQA